MIQGALSFVLRQLIDGSRTHTEEALRQDLAFKASRRKVFAASALLHAGVLLVLLIQPPQTDLMAKVDVVNVSLLAGNKEPSRPTRALEARPPSQSTAAEAPVTDVVPQLIQIETHERVDLERDPASDPVALSVNAAATAQASGDCQLTAWLTAALEADPVVQSALLQIPRPARSVANALMLWDGTWIERERSAAPYLAALRIAVLSGVKAAPDACKTATVLGPELLALKSGDLTTVIAIGSGEWRWVDLVTTDALVLGTASPREVARSER